MSVMQSVLASFIDAGFILTRYERTNGRHRPFWVVKVKLNPDENSSEAVRIGNLNSNRLFFQQRITFGLTVDYDAELLMSGDFQAKWKDKFTVHWKKMDWFPENTTRTAEVAAGVNFLEYINIFAGKIDSYVESVEAVNNIKILSKSQVLPFFLVEDPVQLCAVALKHGLDADSASVTACRENIINVDEVEHYKNLPDEWAKAILFHERKETTG